MTSVEYILRLHQTTESLDTLVREFRSEISLLLSELSNLQCQEDASTIERKCLMALIEVKDEDLKRLNEHITTLSCKVNLLIKELEYKSPLQITHIRELPYTNNSNRHNGEPSWVDHQSDSTETNIDSMNWIEVARKLLF